MTFFGIAEMNRAAEDGRLFRDENLRTAIASSLVLTYLFIVCFTAFVKSSSEAGGGDQGIYPEFFSGHLGDNCFLLRRNCGNPDFWKAQRK